MLNTDWVEKMSKITNLPQLLTRCLPHSTLLRYSFGLHQITHPTPNWTLSWKTKTFCVDFRFLTTSNHPLPQNWTLTWRTCVDLRLQLYTERLLSRCSGAKFNLNLAQLINFSPWLRGRKQVRFWSKSRTLTDLLWARFWYFYL